VIYTGWLYAVGLRAHADRAENARARRDAGAVRDAEGAAAALLKRLERLLESDKWLDSPPPVSVAYAALAAAEFDRLRRHADSEAWKAAADHWRELGFPLELAYARWRQTEAILAGEGTKPEAAEALREAAELASTAGASLLVTEITALARRARIELGGDRGTRFATAVGAGLEHFGLTDRELEVLALVADGRTNPEIGKALFISTKTASAHVSHILSKLEVKSRVEAATAAHRLGLIPGAGERQMGVDSPVP
jgi:DNA-binding CsgD family transcriptional regulator